jgi:hypothetical protein
MHLWFSAKTMIPAASPMPPPTSTGAPASLSSAAPAVAPVPPNVKSRVPPTKAPTLLG